MIKIYSLDDSRFSFEYNDPRSDSDYDEEQLRIGVEIEREHISCDKISKVIAKDHLDQRGDYYDILKKLEEENNIKEVDSGYLSLDRLLHPSWDKRGDFLYDPRELKIGIMVEMEHTDNPIMAKMIAKDHLDEVSNYYQLLDEYGILDYHALEQDLNNRGMFLTDDQIKGMDQI